MARLYISTLAGSLHEMSVDGEFRLPKIVTGEWVTFAGKNGETLSVFSNNIESIHVR